MADSVMLALPVYKPARDGRFEYADDVLSFLEGTSCKNCVHRSTIDPELPACFESAPITFEEPVDFIRDAGTSGVVCVRYEAE